MSIIESILKPYKILFKDSKEKPKEINLEVESEKPEEKVEEISKPKPQPVAPSNNRAGKVLWKKK